MLTGTEARQLLYVAMSRGRDANHVHLAAAADGDPHTVVDPETLAPSTAIEILARVLGRDGSQQSATTTRRELLDPAPRLRDAVLRYQDALGYAAAEMLGAAWRESLDRDAEGLVHGITACPAYPTLAARLALGELSGYDAHRELLDARARGTLRSAHDPAAVLDHRLGDRTPGGPLPWLPGIPRDLAASDWGDHLEQRAELVTELAGEVRATVAGPPPVWAAGADATVHGDLAVWRAAYGVPDTDPRPVGAPVQGAGAAYQRTLTTRLTTPARMGCDWTDVLPATVLRDPRRGVLEARLEELVDAGVDVTPLVDQALAGRPLPTEVPADALLWRLVALASPPAPPPTPPPSSQRALQRVALPHSPGRLGPDEKLLQSAYPPPSQQTVGPAR